MKRYKIAAILMLIHGVMEVGGGLCLIPLLFMGDTNNKFSFIVPYFQEHLNLVLIMGILYGIVRIIGAKGLWNNKMWGLLLSVINCLITMALMLFMLPIGVLDGILAFSALILILRQYFGDREII